MLESLLFGKKKTSPYDKIIAGDATMGYYGFVPPDDFITGSALATAIGLTAGNIQFDQEGWLKFAYNGKQLLVAKKPFRNSLSWQHIYQTGSVYGDDTVGKYPSGSQKLQNRIVTIQGKQYRVRLLRGAVSDPAHSTSAPGRELQDLFFKVLAVKSGPWESFTMADVGQTASSLGKWAWVTETASNLTTARLFMTENAGLSMEYATANSSAFAWRPVLELID
jgi:hypothetical protein